jgi:hypothetical protein
MMVGLAVSLKDFPDPPPTPTSPAATWDTVLLTLEPADPAPLPRDPLLDEPADDEEDGVETEGVVTDGVDPAGVETEGTVTVGAVTVGTVTEGTETDGVLTDGVVTGPRLRAAPCAWASGSAARENPHVVVRSAAVTTATRRTLLRPLPRC